MLNKDNIKKRNKLLIEYFKSRNYNVTLYGDENKPYVILDDKFILPCHVHNFKINFCDKRIGGEILKWVSLNGSIYEINIEKWLQNSELKSIKYILNDATGMYFSGFIQDKFTDETRIHYAMDRSLAKVYFDEPTLKSDLDKLKTHSEFIVKII